MFAFFEKLIPPFPSEPPQQPPHGLWAFCRHYTRSMEGYLLLMALLTGVIAALEVSLFNFLGQLVDWLIQQDPSTLWRNQHTTLITMALVLVLALPLAVLAHSLLVHQTLLGNYPMRIRWLAHRYMLGHSLAFYQNDYAGRIAAKVMQTALSIRESMMKMLDILLFVIVYFGSIVIVIVMAQADTRLMLPFILWLLAYLCILRWFIPRLRRISRIQAHARSTMTGRIVDSYTNIATVKLFAHANREANYARQAMQGFMRTVHPQMRLVTLLHCAVWSLNVLLVFSLASLSIALWQISALSTGAIAVAISLALRLNGMSQWVMWEVSALFENIGVVEDGMNTLTLPREVVDPANAQPIQIQQGQIEFCQLCFGYEQAQSPTTDTTVSPYLFDHFNLCIQPGEKIGLVGRSGAGKSTLISLLLRFHDLERGAILIDGQDISQVQQESLRAQIGVVTQDTSLLHRSIADNLTYGSPHASEADMIHAAQQAQAHDFILALTDPQGRQGYQAHVGERGVKLSGGQRQRIAIARVLLKDAPILVLDEATSALDSEVEAAIQTNLYQLMKGKTVIAIAHRLSTIAAMDRLIVLDAGRILQQGTHTQLLAQPGLYARLWAKQSGGFLGENDR